MRAWTVTRELKRAMWRRAASALGRESRASDSSKRTWRWRLEGSTKSRSMRVRVPTPARARSDAEAAPMARSLRWRRGRRQDAAGRQRRCRERESDGSSGLYPRLLRRYRRLCQRRWIRGSSCLGARVVGTRLRSLKCIVLRSIGNCGGLSLGACFCAVCIQISGSDPRRPERRQGGSFIACSS